MMVANGGCARTQADYVGLLETARLQLVQVASLPGLYIVMDVAPALRQ